MTTGSIITLIVAFLVVAVVFRMLRRGQLREKYAILWLSLGLVTVVLAGFPQILLWISQALGVQVPANLIFSMALFLLVCVTLHLSWELSTVEEEARVLAENVAILRSLMSAMEDRLASIESAQPADNTGPCDNRN